MVNSLYSDYRPDIAPSKRILSISPRHSYPNSTMETIDSLEDYLKLKCDAFDNCFDYSRQNCVLSSRSAE